VAGQIGAQIAAQTKQKTIFEAEGQARAIEIVGEAEGKKFLAVGGAKAEAYERQVAALGQLNLTGIEVTKAIAEAGLKIAPDVLVTGSGDGAGTAGCTVTTVLCFDDKGSHPIRHRLASIRCRAPAPEM
jgi:hypothetical protein